jgi:hypothetical protein
MKNILELSKVTRGWVLALIASHDKENKIRWLMSKYWPGYKNLVFVQTKWDSMFIADCGDRIAFGMDGTRSSWAWISNFMAWNKDGFPRGMKTSLDGLFDDIYERTVFDFASCYARNRFEGGGQSRAGGGIAYLNYRFRIKGYKVETFGFNPMFNCYSDGYEKMRKAGVCHTYFPVEPFSSLPADPVDNMKPKKGRHYGHREVLLSSSGPFAHSYQVTNGLLQDWMREEPRRNIFKDDADFLADLGPDIIKK